MSTRTTIFRRLLLIIMLAILVHGHISQHENGRFFRDIIRPFVVHHQIPERCVSLSNSVRTLVLAVVLLSKIRSETAAAFMYFKRICVSPVHIFKTPFQSEVAIMMKISEQRRKNGTRMGCQGPDKPAENAVLCYEFRFKAKGFHIPRELCAIVDDAQRDVKMPVGSESCIYSHRVDSVHEQPQTRDRIAVEPCVNDFCVKEENGKDEACKMFEHFFLSGGTLLKTGNTRHFLCPYYLVSFICHCPYYDDAFCSLCGTVSLSLDCASPCTFLKDDLAKKLKGTDVVNYVQDYFCHVTAKHRHKRNVFAVFYSHTSPLYFTHHGIWQVRPFTRFLPDATHNPDIDLAHVGYRLATLSALPPSVPVSRVRLAEAGFYYRGQGDEMICYWCHARHSGWTSQDNPLEVHRRISPNCPHVAERSGQRDVPSSYQGAGSNASGQRHHSSSLAAENTSQNSQATVAGITAGVGNTSVSQSQGQATQAGSTAHGATESFPVQATHNFAGISNNRLGGTGSASEGTAGAGEGVTGGQIGGACANRGTSAEAGNGGNVGVTATTRGESSPARMGLKGGAPSASTGYDHPDDRGGHNSSNPRHGVQSRATGDDGRGQRVASQTSGAQGSSGGGASARHLFPRAGLDLGGAVYPMYQDMASRRRSFENWDERRAPSLDQIILCGMFYAGYADCVRCFYCGVGLKHWEPTDDVWAEHIRWRPSCGYLRAIKGDDYIRRTQARLAREGENEEDSERSAGGGTGNGSDRNTTAAPAPASANQRQNASSNQRETTAPPSVTSPPVISPPSVTTASTPSSQTASVTATAASTQIPLTSATRSVTTSAVSVASFPSVTSSSVATPQSGPETTSTSSSGSNNSRTSSTVPDRVERPSSQAPSGNSVFNPLSAGNSCGPCCKHGPQELTAFKR